MKNFTRAFTNTKSKLNIKGLLALFALLLTMQSGWGQVSIAAGGNITQPFTIGTTATAAMPTGWKIDAVSAVRTLGTYSAALSATANTAGASMSSSAAGGIWNLGAGTDNTGTDRAVGGVSTTSANRTINVYAFLSNSGAGNISSFTISYDVEKYRTGTNTNSSIVQMYTSTDGSTWSTAGSNFLTTFAGADASVAGYVTAPGVTSSVTAQTLTTTVAPAGVIYLAWSITFATGTTGVSSQVLALDNVSITANGVAASTPPTLTAASSPTVDSNFNVTYTDDATWRAAVTAVKYNGTTLTASTDYTFSAGVLTLKPSGTVGGPLRTAGSATLTISATGYSDTFVTQAIVAGVPAALTMTTQPVAPATSGAVLATMPVVTVKDQYANVISGSVVTAAVTSGQGSSWTLGGASQTATTNASGVATFTTFTATNTTSPSAPYSTASLTFTPGTGTGSVTSSTFTVKGIAPTITAASGATVDAAFDATFTDNATWRAAITGITVGGTSLTAGYSTATAGKITFIHLQRLIQLLYYNLQVARLLLLQLQDTQQLLLHKL